MAQIALLDLLDSFRVRSAADFGRLPPGDRTYFVSRLYSYFESQAAAAEEDIRGSGGLKLLFRSDPASDPDARTPTQTFLSKSAFYANRTVVTFPLDVLRHPGKRRVGEPFFVGRIDGLRTARGGDVSAYGPIYRSDAERFGEFLLAVERARPALAAGVGYVWPTYSSRDAKRWDRRSLRLTTANFRMRELRRQWQESGEESFRLDMGLTRLYLPHFTGIPFERVLEIRSRESALYAEMQRTLEQLMFAAGGSNSESQLLTYLREVDQGVRATHRRFLDIQSEYRRKDIYMSVKFLMSGLVLLAPIEARETVAGLLGSFSAFDYFSSREGKSKAMADLRSDAFYLPWRVFRVSNQPKG